MLFLCGFSCVTVPSGSFALAKLTLVIRGFNGSGYDNPPELTATLVASGTCSGRYLRSVDGTRSVAKWRAPFASIDLTNLLIQVGYYKTREGTEVNIQCSRYSDILER